MSSIIPKPQPLDTSKVIMEVNQDKQFTYYLPGYMRLNVKNFTSLNLENLEAQVNAAIIFSVYYGALPEHLVDVLQKQLKLNFERDETIQLTEQDNLMIQAKRVKDKNTLHFYVKKIWHLRVQGDIFWTPFQIIHTIFSITIQSIIIGNTVLEINLMDHPDKIQKLFTSELTSFGQYELAVAYTQAQYSNRGIRKAKQFKEQSSSNNSARDEENLPLQDILIQIIDKNGNFLIAENMGCFRHAHFNIPLYKRPISSITTIFIPLWLLGIINLGVFFQSGDLGNRMQSISGIMVAFAALIPTIRNQIPSHAGWLFIEILVYIQAATCLLALFDSINVRLQQDYNILWHQNVFFIASVAISILTFIYVLAMLFIHYVIWKPKYQAHQKPQRQIKYFPLIFPGINVKSNKSVQSSKAESEKKIQSKILTSRLNLSNNNNHSIRFIRSQWKNHDCDKVFYEIRNFQTSSVFMQLQEPEMLSENGSEIDIKDKIQDLRVDKTQLAPHYLKILKNISLSDTVDKYDNSAAGSSQNFT